MLIELRSPDRQPAPPMSTDEQPPFNCPKCGVRLHTHNSRTDLDSKGQPERVFVYLCFVDGLFTFRNSKGLVDGL
jgi:hypothetical protein